MRGRTLDLEVVDKRGKAAKTIPLYQYDYGQKLIIKGVELPEYYEVHFSNQQYGEAVTVLGDSTGVLIPDSLVATGESIYVWLYLHDTSYDGETEYMGVIPVIKRAEPSDVTPTPEEQSIITEVIAALNNMEDDMSDQVNEAKAAKEAAEDAQAGAEAAESAVEGYASAAATAKEAAETAQTAAETAQAAAEVASNVATTAYNNADSARASAVSAKEYAETAATNASNSATSASNSAASASNSASAAEGYETAAETAQGKAEDAQAAAEAAQAAAEAAEDGAEADALIAEGYAVGKQNGEDVASGSTYYHNNAKYYADTASDSATAAAGSEDNAEDSAEDAEAYAVGTRGGVDVESDDPAYENNAKYYAEEAATVLADKLDAPATAGTQGQVLTSDGEGGQAWADPSGAIDDTAGSGDTDVTWSADKLDGEFTDVLNNIQGKYTLPSGGIPDTDLSSGIQTSLGLANTAYQKPVNGIPASDIADGVIPPVDSELSDNSTNAVQNKIVKGALDGKAPVIINTATGNPAVFNDGGGMPLKSLLIPFTTVQSGTGDPSPQNIRPLVPWNGLTVFGGGKNLFNKDDPNIQLDKRIATGGTIINSQYGQAVTGFIPVKEGAKYIINSYINENYFSCFYSEKDITKPVDAMFGNNEFPKTAPKGAKYLIVTIGNVGIDGFQIEVGQTASVYEPYAPITEADISFPSPVYGGTLDVVSGVMKPYKRIEYGGQSVWSQASDVSGKHRFYRTLSDIRYGVNVKAVSACNEFTPVQQGDYTTDNNVQCSRHDPQLFIVTSEIETRVQLSQFLSEHPLTIVYEPVSPQEQTLTGHQITALVGDNTIWSDADGSMTVEYPADTKTYIDNLIATAIASL